MRFSIDTSAILDGWTRHYPREAFPGLWQHLEELIESGHLRASEEVRYELAKKEDEALEWAERQDRSSCQSMTTFRMRFLPFSLIIPG